MAVDTTNQHAKAMNGGGNVRPVPDPTELTTIQLKSEIAALKEILSTRIDAMDHRISSEVFVARQEREMTRTILETRIAAMDKSTSLLQDTTDKFPARVDEKIKALEGVHEEKFESIATQFTERDARTEQTSRDSKVAVDAALQAAKEAVAEQNRSSALAIAKSETATVKQIDQQGLLIQSMTKGFDDKIDDLKERLTRIEGSTEGSRIQVSTHQASGNYTAVIIGLILTFLFGSIGIIIAIMMRGK